MEVITIKKIYTIKANTFYDDGSFYYITHSSHPDRYFKIDRNENLLKHLQKIVKKYSSLLMRDHGENRGLSIAKYGTLNQIIYAYYTKKSISAVKAVRGFVAHLNKDVLDCTFENLYHTNDTNFDDICRRIWHDDSYIYFLHKKTNTLYTMTYKQEFLSVLASPKLSWYIEQDGRLYAKIRGRKKKQRDVSIQRLAYWSYHHKLTANTLITQLNRLQKQFRKTGTAIDHLDHDICNNTIYNLSPMVHSFNSGKQIHPRKYFKQIFRLDMAYKDGSYLLRFIYKPKLFTDELRTIDYRCDSPEDLIQKIKGLKENKWLIRARKEGVILTDNKNYSIGGKLPFLQYIEANKSDIEIQRELGELI